MGYGGMQMDLSQGTFESSGSNGGGYPEGRPIAYNIKTLSYDANHVRVSLELHIGEPGMRDLSGKFTTWSTVVDLLEAKPVTFHPIPNMNVVVSMKTNSQFAQAELPAPSP